MASIDGNEFFLATKDALGHNPTCSNGTDNQFSKFKGIGAG
jgi:hypothetical protein